MINPNMEFKDMIFRCTAGAVVAASFLGPESVSAGNRMQLHYDRPAEFFEEALVIGNGNIGAVLYGGVKEERLSLNDITLWTGEPERELSSPDAFRAIP